MKMNAKNMIAIAGTAILMTGFAACKKDSNNTTTTPTPTPTPTTYPKTVSIEYKLVSEAGLDSVSTIGYTNESGGNSSAMNVKLPFSKKITRTVNKYDNVAYAFNAYGAGTLRLTILVDGTSVKDQTFSGTNVISGSIAYIFQ